MIRTTTSNYDGNDPDESTSPQFVGPAPTLGERLVGSGQAAMLRMLSSTWRVECRGLEMLEELECAHERHILAFWHGNYITLFRLFHDRPTVAITNASHRGRIIAEICHHSGMQTLQAHGRGSKQMLQALDDAAGDGLGLAIAVDGPLGPPQIVKRVVLHLAARLNCQIVPVSVATASRYTFKRRWDRLEIPYLFSRVAFVVGSPIRVPATTSKAGLRKLETELKDRLERGETVASRLLDRPQALKSA